FRSSARVLGTANSTARGSGGGNLPSSIRRIRPVVKDGGILAPDDTPTTTAAGAEIPRPPRFVPSETGTPAPGLMFFSVFFILYPPSRLSAAGRRRPAPG